MLDKQLSLGEILLRKPKKSEVWKSEEHGTVIIDGIYIDIQDIDTWLIGRDDLFTLTEGK